MALVSGKKKQLGKGIEAEIALLAAVTPQALTETAEKGLNKAVKVVRERVQGSLEASYGLHGFHFTDFENLELLIMMRR